VLLGEVECVVHPSAVRARGSANWSRARTKYRPRAWERQAKRRDAYRNVFNTLA
jgi:hypothetical protein